MDIDLLRREAVFRAVTSSGPGGQHVNKVATKVQVSLDVVHSSAFAKAEKPRIINYLKKRLTKEGVLLLSCQESRSQAKNKEMVFEKLIDLLKKASIPEVRRKATRVPKGVKRKRLDNKKRNSEKKQNRNFKI